MALLTSPADMQPLSPDASAAELEALALQVVEAAARLSGAVHPLTARAIAEFLRPMNSYYSNLIEGHDTNPHDIDRALHQDFSVDARARSLQEEATAHIAVHQQLTEQLATAGSGTVNYFEASFWTTLHREFYAHLPAEFRWVKTKEGREVEVVPGEFRTMPVVVGQHVAPAPGSLPNFVEAFTTHYSRERNRLRRLINLAASHHRFAWIHPFLDGNGRVGRLLSDAGFMAEGLGAGGLWSLSRGLARNEQEYKALLAQADRTRWHDYDGRGRLSERELVAFCRFFLTTALDQLQYMTQVLNLDDMLTRIDLFVDYQSARKLLSTEARYVLRAAFLQGELPRRDIARLINKSDKPAKQLATQLVKWELLRTNPADRFAPYQVAYPLRFSPLLFAGLYPQGKDVDMLARMN